MRDRCRKNCLWNSVGEHISDYRYWLQFYYFVFLFEKFEIIIKICF